MRIIYKKVFYNNKTLFIVIKNIFLFNLEKITIYKNWNKFNYLHNYKIMS